MIKSATVHRWKLLLHSCCRLKLNQQHSKQGYSKRVDERGARKPKLIVIVFSLGCVVVVEVVALGKLPAFSNNDYGYSQNLQVILFEIAIFLHKFIGIVCQFISWTNWVNSGKFVDNYWISCQVKADMKKSLQRSHNYLPVHWICFFSRWNDLFFKVHSFLK